MKALAVSLFCLALASPAYAFGHAGGHPGGPRPGGPHPGGGHGGHHHHGFGFVGGFYDPYYATPDDSTPPDLPPPRPSVVVVQSAPAPMCSDVAAAPALQSGPHIIYIGHKPTINGPRVIYGSDF